MAELGKRAGVAVSMMGKIKTTMQMAAIIILLFENPQASSLLTIIGYVALYIYASLTIWSMFMYLKAAWPACKRMINGRGLILWLTQGMVVLCLLISIIVMFSVIVNSLLTQIIF